MPTDGNKVKLEYKEASVIHSREELARNSDTVYFLHGDTSEGTSQTPVDVGVGIAVGDKVIADAIVPVVFKDIQTTPPGADAGVHHYTCSVTYSTVQNMLRSDQSSLADADPKYVNAIYYPSGATDPYPAEYIGPMFESSSDSEDTISWFEFHVPTLGTLKLFNDNSVEWVADEVISSKKHIVYRLAISDKYDVLIDDAEDQSTRSLNSLWGGMNDCCILDDEISLITCEEDSSICDKESLFNFLTDYINSYGPHLLDQVDIELLLLAPVSEGESEPDTIVIDEKEYINIGSTHVNGISNISNHTIILSSDTLSINTYDLSYLKFNIHLSSTTDGDDNLVVLQTSSPTFEKTLPDDPYAKVYLYYDYDETEDSSSIVGGLHFADDTKSILPSSPFVLDVVNSIPFFPTNHIMSGTFCKSYNVYRLIAEMDDETYYYLSYVNPCLYNASLNIANALINTYDLTVPEYGIEFPLEFQTIWNSLVGTYDPELSLYVTYNYLNEELIVAETWKRYGTRDQIVIEMDPEYLTIAPGGENNVTSMLNTAINIEDVTTTEISYLTTGVSKVYINGFSYQPYVLYIYIMQKLLGTKGSVSSSENLPIEDIIQALSDVDFYLRYNISTSKSSGTIANASYDSESSAKVLGSSSSDSSSSTTNDVKVVKGNLTVVSEGIRRVDVVQIPIIQFNGIEISSSSSSDSGTITKSGNELVGSSYDSTETINIGLMINHTVIKNLVGYIVGSEYLRADNIISDASTYEDIMGKASLFAHQFLAFEVTSVDESDIIFGGNAYSFNYGESESGGGGEK